LQILRDQTPLKSFAQTFGHLLSAENIDNLELERRQCLLSGLDDSNKGDSEDSNEYDGQRDELNIDYAQLMGRYNSNFGQNSNVDYAQMEYNVKQFLLKQNEWSGCRRLSEASSYQENESCNNNSGTSTKYTINPHRTETNL
jgi:hypothetical protein